MADDTPIPDDAFLLAGEYALGVLEGDDLAAAGRAVLRDRPFAEAVDWWERRLGAMAEAVGEIQPSPSVWKGIEARLAADAPMQAYPLPKPRSGPSGWSIATALAGLGAAAVALALFLYTPRTIERLPPDIALAPDEQLVAQLQDAESGRKLAGVIDPDNRRLALTIEGFQAERGFAPELWVIPQGGAPISLGAIPEAGSFARDISQEEAGLLVAGATLAVTFERDTGARHATPTPPILIAGALDRV